MIRQEKEIDEVHGDQLYRHNQPTSGKFILQKQRADPGTYRRAAMGAACICSLCWSRRQRGPQHQGSGQVQHASFRRREGVQEGYNLGPDQGLVSCAAVVQRGVQVVTKNMAVKRQGVEVLSCGVPGFSRCKSDCNESFFALVCAGLFDKTCTVFQSLLRTV